MICSVFICYLLANTCTATSTVIPEDLEEEERLAFNVCDSDKMVGLTWGEMEQCEERFAALLAAQNITLPSREDFEAVDVNGDGTLTFEEWMKRVEEILENTTDYSN
eukprot:GFUD01019615.1.p1 GENE.GFUD01019615.1~~GFUD01019615.1.p1  ORF type:complete len:107 (+),score=30.92 GFUD01019615.1:219-539(+)